MHVCWSTLHACVYLGLWIWGGGWGRWHMRVGPALSVDASEHIRGHIGGQISYVRLEMLIGGWLYIYIYISPFHWGSNPMFDTCISHKGKLFIRWKSTFASIVRHLWWLGQSQHLSIKYFKCAHRGICMCIYIDWVYVRVRECRVVFF